MHQTQFSQKNPIRRVFPNPVTIVINLSCAIVIDRAMGLTETESEGAARGRGLF